MNFLALQMKRLDLNRFPKGALEDFLWAPFLLSENGVE